MDDQSLVARTFGEKFLSIEPRTSPAVRRNSFQIPLINSVEKCIKLIWCVFSLSTPTVNASAQDISIQPLTNALVSESLRYRMLTGRVEVGQVIVNIVNKQEDEFIHIVESTSGLMERTTTLLVRKDSTLSSRTSHTVMSNAALSQEVELQYEARKVTGAVMQPAKLGGTKEVGFAFLSQTQDYYIVPYFLRSCALQVNQVIKFPVYEALRNQVELARGWVVKLEEVEVTAGKFVCYRVEGFTGRLRWILYFDREFPHRLIKQTLPALHLEMELAGVKPSA